MTEILQCKIIIVDDDEDDRMIIQDAFQEIGFEADIKILRNDSELLHYLDDLAPVHFPSLIVLDNMLGGLEASDILHVLKAHPAYKSIPVVVFTTLLSPSAKKHLLSIGAYACMEKAATMQNMVETVTKMKDIAESNSNELK